MKILPRTVRGWMACVAWFALLLALVGNCQVEIIFEHLPRDPRFGPATAMHMDVKLLGVEWSYTGNRGYKGTKTE